MDRKFWHYFAIGFLAINTLCVFILFEVLIYGRPYGSAFLVLFLVMYRINSKILFRQRKLPRGSGVL